MRKFGPSRLFWTAGAGALAVGCTLAVAGVSAANASTQRPNEISGLAVQAGSVTAQGATFTWNRSARAGTYRLVIVNASTPGASPAYDSGYTLHGTSDTVTSLQPGTAYEARVDAANGGGNASWCNWVMLYTTAAPGAQGPSGAVSTTTVTLESDASGNSFSVPTGGRFSAGAKLLDGKVPLKAGTYLLNVNFTATPNATPNGSGTGAVFPQLFVYNGTAKSDFSNDLYNVGAGALAPYNSTTPSDQVNSYYSGSDVITVPDGGATLDVYAFGYDSDHSAGSYELNSATLTATQLDVAGS